MIIYLAGDGHAIEKKWIKRRKVFFLLSFWGLRRSSSEQTKRFHHIIEIKKIEIKKEKKNAGKNKRTVNNPTIIKTRTNK
jgi:hypothetical protein